jgi:propanediol dehydratase small subunit
VLSGEIAPGDVRIRPETLELQAQIAEQAHRPQLARNLRRAAELCHVPDERILEIYNSLRPGRATGAQLEGLAVLLEQEYGAMENARFVREAAALYVRRDLLPDTGH